MKIRCHRDLIVYQKSFRAAMEIFEMTKTFPKEELYSLTDQIRRSSRSVSANISEAFRKRIYPKAFIAKITDCEAEASETQVWLQFARDCKYIHEGTFKDAFNQYEEIIAILVSMRLQPNLWKP